MILKMLEVCDVRSWLPKTDDNDRAHKNDANTLFLHMVNASLCTSASYKQFKSLVFGILKTLCYFKDPLPLRTGFSHKMRSMQYVWHMLHLIVARQILITLSSCTSEFSSISGKDAELNRQFPLGIDLNKILPVVRIKAKNSDIHFS